MLITKLTTAQHGLSYDLRSSRTFLHDKLISSCQGVLACRYAVADPPAEVGALITKLQSSIMAVEKEDTTNHGVYFTDRRYHSNSRNDPRPYN